MTRPRVCGVSGQLADNVGAAENLLKRDELDAQLGCDLRIGIGIMGDEAHVERPRQTEQLGADVADAHRAENAAD